LDNGRFYSGPPITPNNRVCTTGIEAIKRSILKI
jgi:hypothetical protein